jgi:Fuc2NAc and GlcNAc transferase
MSGIVAGVGLLTGVVSAILTALLCKYAERLHFLDRPNPRSSHTRPTPRGGGVAIVVSATTGLVALACVGLLSARLTMSLVGGGLIVAAVGLADDRRSLPAGVRLSAHAVAALWALYCLGGAPALQMGNQIVELGWVGYGLGGLAIVWVINLFNFMDGIDGIAASEAVFVSAAAAFLGLVTLVGTAVVAGNIVFAAACLGFLAWNWPPARIFMGDTGSGYLGFMIAVFALAASHQSTAAPWVWLILGAVFLADSTVTLTTRLARGQRITEAHRSHAYQWLARRWQSHLSVVITVWAINIAWLLPLAYIAARVPRLASWLTLLALLPVAAMALAARAGRAEATDT